MRAIRDRDYDKAHDILSGSVDVNFLGAEVGGRLWLYVRDRKRQCG